MRILKNSRGFTLVELMIVVAIMGMLSIIAVTSTVNILPRYKLQKAARDMVSSFRNARIMAIKFNRSVVVEFNTTGGYYTLDGNKRTLTDYYGSGGIKFGFPGRSDSVHFSSGGTSIAFNATGLASGVTGYVYIQNSNGQGYRIGVSSLAGSIKMDKCGSVDCTLNP